MGFFSNLISATVKTGEEPDATKSLLESAGDDVKEATDNLADGEIL